MKNSIVFTTIIFVLFSGIAFAGQYGAPEPTARDGNAYMGIGYLYAKNTLERKNATPSEEYTTERNEVYVQFGAAFNRIEGYIRLGGASLKIDDVPATGNSFSDSGKIFGTIGAKGIYNVNPLFGFGAFFQATLYDKFSDSSSGINIQVKDLCEISGGLALQFKIDRIIVYGGPLLYWSQAKNAEFDENYETKNNFGGMGGIRVNLGQGFGAEVEGQYINKFSVGGMLTYSF